MAGPQMFELFDLCDATELLDPQHAFFVQNLTAARDDERLTIRLRDVTGIFDRFLEVMFPRLDVGALGCRPFQGRSLRGGLRGRALDAP